LGYTGEDLVIIHEGNSGTKRPTTDDRRRAMPWLSLIMRGAGARGQEWDDVTRTECGLHSMASPCKAVASSLAWSRFVGCQNVLTRHSSARTTRVRNDVLLRSR